MPAEHAVLVPIILGAGLVFSVLTEVRDIGHRVRGRHWLDRRAEVHGHATARAVLHGPDAPSRPGTQPGLRARAAYVLTMVVFGTLTVWVGRGSWGNFVGWTWWAKRISWIFAGSLAFTVAFATITLVAATITWRWPRPPTWTIPWLARTPLGQEDRRPPSP
jgi:hypothetical protein